IHKPFTVGDLLKALQFHCGHLAQESAPAESAPAAAAPEDDAGLFDPVIRAELATMARNGRSDFVERVEGLYATNAPLRFQDLKDAVAAGDADAAARGAHALKSMSLSLGAAAVSAAASTAENTARAGQPEAIDLPALALLIDRTLACFGRGAAPETGEATPDDGAVRSRFDQALKDGHLHLVYQPMMARSGDFSGKVEALVRWTCPERGARSPEEFVPELEAAGMIADLTDFVMTRVMQDGAARDDVRISFNASADEFQKVGFADRVAVAARREGFPLERLEVEVTETAILDIEGARPTLDRLQAMGVAVALDDFGAGYTSLHALRELRFSTLKIDRSFVTRCTEDTASAAIIHAVIGVGRSLGMSIVCEGVETEAQAQFLKTAGVHLIQGYVYRRPCAFADLPTCGAKVAA
ncbi:MAG: EAL domain-containing protein, partial [Brevundimonas sp.]